MKELRFHLDDLVKNGLDDLVAEDAMIDGWGRRRRDGDYFEVLGRTGDGDFVQLVVAEYSDYLWVFHGRKMNDSEKRRYRRERKI